ncbi:hypothetical protein ACIRPT_27125 [Streptomyces sp. NPDC101227]|uniref:hypothetical protein n=1 Tax=Streptomyces sp. NPDC101227 TaxID=3366136 RepID=UPI00381D81EB
MEESLGERSLHDMALESLDGTRALPGVCNARSDIDLVCYGSRGSETAQMLFAERSLIRP